MAILAAWSCLLLAGCGAPVDDAAGGDDARGDVPTSEPAEEETTADGGNGDEDEEPAIEVAGPTISNDYPEYFGNIYRDQTAKCANFSSYLPYPVTVVAVSVGAPLVIVTDCTPNSGDAASDACLPGVVLGVLAESDCTLGVVFADDADLTANHLVTVDWRLAVDCPDTAGEPCSAPEVVAEGPTPEAPVHAEWVTSQPVRYCGATDYATDTGEPGGFGYPPSSGCTEAAPESESASADADSG